MTDEKEISIKESFQNLKNYIKKESGKSKVERYKFFKSYKVDRYIVKGAMILTFVFLFMVAYLSNFELDYYVCGDPEGCINPFYKETTWKNNLDLPRGEYGNKPGQLFNSMGLIIFGILGLAAAINHFVHNKKKEETNETKNRDNHNSLE